jgi:hypothetical protein
MPTDPETSLAFAAAVQHLANWTGGEVPPSPAAVVAIARRPEIAAHAQVERAVRRGREEGQSWAAVASLLGLDALPCHVADPARLAFDCCTGLARPPELTGPGSCGTALPAARPSPTSGRLTARRHPAETRRRMRAPEGRRRRVGTEAVPMTGPEHYQQAERLLEHAGRMLEEHVGDEGLAEFLQRQAVTVAMASAHAALADAAAAGLSAHLDTIDTQAWRRAAGSALDA